MTSFSAAARFGLAGVVARGTTAGGVDVAVVLVVEDVFEEVVLVVVVVVVVVVEAVA